MKASVPAAARPPCLGRCQRHGRQSAPPASRRPALQWCSRLTQDGITIVDQAKSDAQGNFTFNQDSGRRSNLLRSGIGRRHLQQSAAARERRRPR